VTVYRVMIFSRKKKTTSYSTEEIMHRAVGEPESPVVEYWCPESMLSVRRAEDPSETKR